MALKARDGGGGQEEEGKMQQEDVRAILDQRMEYADLEEAQPSDGMSATLKAYQVCVRLPVPSCLSFCEIFISF